MNYKRNFYILLFLATLASISLCYYSYQQHLQVNFQQDQITALTDTVILYKNKKGLNGAIKTVFTGTMDEVLQATNEVNKTAYNAVKSDKSIVSYTELKTVTKIDTVVSIDTVSSGKEVSHEAFPLHVNRTINNEFYTAEIEVDNDSLRLGLVVLNDFDITTRKKSNGFLRRKTLVVDVLNKNPYTVTNGLTSFEIKPKKRKGLKIILGVAVGVGALLLLK